MRKGCAGSIVKVFDLKNTTRSVEIFLAKPGGLDLENAQQRRCGTAPTLLSFLL